MFSAQGKAIPATHLSDQLSEQEQQQIFQLIDRLLSFEACLYHQILPLKLEEDQLVLGMVYLEDNDALDYVHRFLGYLNLNMVTEMITAEIHRITLSAYLNYKNTIPNNSPSDHQLTTEITPKNLTTIPAPTDHPQPVITPQELITPQEQPEESDSTPEPSSSTHHLLKPLTIGSTSNSIAPVEIPTIFSPPEVLGTLPPKKLLAELLGRILSARIGRLYLERQPYEGKITWSENGVLQSGLKKVPLSIFQGLLNELKRFASLPMTKITEPQQVEKEYIYKEKNLLLRWRVMPGTHGEEATIQVLQESALKSYHQEQLHRLNHETLVSIHHLKHCLHHIREILIADSQLKPQQLEALTHLTQLAENIDQQVKILIPTNSEEKK